MTRLDRLVLNEIVSPFIGSALLFTGLFFAGGDLLRFAGYLQGGAGWWLVGQMILYRFPMVLALTFPMAILLGTLLGFSRLSSDSELVALVAAGISFERIVTPVVVFGLLISLVGYWFNQTVVPTANAHGEALVNDYKKRGGANLDNPAAFTLPIRDGDNQLLLHVEGGVDASALGGSGQVGPARCDHRAACPRTGRRLLCRQTCGLDSGHDQAVASCTTGRPPTWATTTGAIVGFGETDAAPTISLDSPGNLADLQLPVEQVPTDRLRRRAAVLRAGGSQDDARKAEVEIARREALPFASLMFALIGAPLGVSPKRAGKGMGFGLSVLITFAYWMGMQVLGILAQGGLLPPLVALMIPNAVCLAVAVWLNRRVLRA